VDNDLKVGDEHHDDQVPEAPQRQQDDEQPDRQRVQDPPGGEGGQGPPGPLQPGAAQPGQPPDDRVVHDRDLDGEAAQPAREDRERERDQHDRGDQPAHAADLEVMG
jgi:hypothetical protein